MKIGFFTDSYLPTISGLETALETFRKGLENLGHEVYIFAPFYKGYKDKNPRVFRFRSLKILKKPDIHLASPFSSVNHFKKIKDIKLDIIHAHTPFTLGLLAKHFAKHQRIPILFTYHTQYPEYAKFYFKERLILPYLARALVAWFSNISDATIAPSYKIKRFLREYGAKKTIYILPTGVNIDIFKEPKKENQNLRKKLKISPKTKLLIFVGRVAGEKNLGFLVHMFKELLSITKIPVNFLIVGDGPYFEELQQIVKEIQIEQFVKFTGQVFYKNMPQFYQIADLFVFSSLTDTQGIVILEAMASGLPAIALKDDAFREIIINNKNGFLINFEQNKHKNKKAEIESEKRAQKIFAQKVSTLLTSPSLYKKFSTVARQTACQFSEQRQAEKLVNIYQKLIDLKKE